MLKSIQNRLTFANVISSLALFAALGGTAIAASVAANSVGTRQLKDQAVTSSKIKDNAVTGSKVNLSTLGTVPTANRANSADTVVAGGVRSAALAPITVATQTTAPFPSNTAGSTFVQCPAGTTLISGGGAPSATNVYTTLSRKSDPNGWRYDALNETGAPASISVYAYCLS